MRLHPALFAVLASGACATGMAPDDDDLGTASVEVRAATTPVPADGQCVHVVATRLSDFKVSEFMGPLDGALLKTRQGEHRVTAVAYPPPCNIEPDDPPWIADEQIVTFTGGANTLKLSFHKNVKVDIDADFLDDEPAPLLVRTGFPVRVGRNGEDAAAGHFSLDGWEVKALALPPGPASETTLFSVEGKGGLPFAPRGMAVTTDGDFVFGVTDILEPLRRFDGAGNFLESWSVVDPMEKVHWDFTDGLETIDATHFVRTGFLNTAIGCDAGGAGCIQAGLDILEKKTSPADGSTYVEVVDQIFLPEPFNRDYPVGVTPWEGNYLVATLPEGFTRLVLVAGDGTFLAEGQNNRDVEGLFVSDDGRLFSLDYEGHTGVYQRSGEVLQLTGADEVTYHVGVDYSLPSSITWSDAAGFFVVLNGFKRVAYASADFQGNVSDIGLDLSDMESPSAIDLLPETNRLAVIDRLPPIDEVNGGRRPVVRLYDLGAPATPPQSLALVGGPTLPVRQWSIAYRRAQQELLATYRRPGGVLDAALDATIYVHRLDGTLARTIALGPIGVKRVVSVSTRPTTDELLLVVEVAGQTRLLVTDAAGAPRRSYALAGLGNDVAAVGSGPFAGDLGVVKAEPSQFARIALP